MAEQKRTQLALVGSALVFGCYLTSQATAFLAPLPAAVQPTSGSPAPFESRRRQRSSFVPPTAFFSSVAPLESVAEDATATTGSAAGGGLTDVLARKAKLKEVESLKQLLPADHPIFLELGKVGQYNASTALYMALKRPATKTLTVIAEYSRKANWGYLGSVLNPQDYSDVYREAGAAAIAVNVDATTGGCSYDDIKAVADEQRMAVNSRPEVLAAVPVICSDAVVDTFQIARAKLAGATGITIRYGLNAADKTKELVETTLGLGMEPLMLVRNPEEAREAVALGAKLLLLIGSSRSKASEMRSQLPGDGVMVGYDLKRPKEYQGGLKEVEDAWLLRDDDFHCVYASDALWQSGLDDVTGPSAVIRALRAKACHFLVEPLDWIERCVMDGTKETLGELLM